MFVGFFLRLVNAAVSGNVAEASHGHKSGLIRVLCVFHVVSSNGEPGIMRNPREFRQLFASEDRHRNGSRLVRYASVHLCFIDPVSYMEIGGGSLCSSHQQLGKRVHVVSAHDVDGRSLSSLLREQ